MRRSVNLTWAEIKVGLVVMVGFVIFTLAILSFGTIRSVFAPRSILAAQFPEVKGLKAGAPVWLSGVEVGNVQAIRFARAAQRSGILVVMEVDTATREIIRSDATATIRTQGLLGDQYIEISMGSASAPPLPANATLQGTLPVGIMELVSGSSETVEEMTRFLKTISNVTSDQILKFIQNLNALLLRLNQGVGTTGRLINDPSLYNEVRDLATEGRELVKKLEEDRGTAGQLLENPELYNRLSAAAGSLEAVSQKLEKGEGTLGKLMSNEEAYEHLNRAAERIDRLTARIDSGQGVAGELIQDQELSKDLKGLVAELRALVADIRQNPKKYFKVTLF